MFSQRAARGGHRIGQSVFGTQWARAGVRRGFAEQVTPRGSYKALSWYGTTPNMNTDISVQMK